MEEYDDIDFSNNDSIHVDGFENPTEFEQKVSFSKDTSDFDSSTYEIISPEEAQQERLNEIRNQRFANEEFGKAVESIEAKLGRQINVEEYDKLCRSYATILCEEDAKILKDKHVDGITRQEYYDQLIENKPVVRAAKSYYEKHEEALVNDIAAELERVKSIPAGELTVKAGKPINFKHQGSVKIAEESKGVYYRINNKDDVKLINMKNRQLWLDKRYPEEIASEMGETNVHRDDDFE